MRWDTSFPPPGDDNGKGRKIFIDVFLGRAGIGPGLGPAGGVAGNGHGCVFSTVFGFPFSAKKEGDVINNSNSAPLIGGYPAYLIHDSSAFFPKSCFLSREGKCGTAAPGCSFKEQARAPTPHFTSQGNPFPGHLSVKGEALLLVGRKVICVKDLDGDEGRKIMVPHDLVSRLI